MKETIYNYEEKENGCYFVYYKSKCGKEKLIEGRTVILDTGYSLKSINPPWINLSYVNTTILKLEYDDDMEKKQIYLFVYIKLHLNVYLIILLLRLKLIKILYSLILIILEKGFIMYLQKLTDLNLEVII